MRAKPLTGDAGWGGCCDGTIGAEATSRIPGSWEGEWEPSPLGTARVESLLEAVEIEICIALLVDAATILMRQNRR